MSAESHPIDASRFALAIQDLPIENLYSKAQEINNSISHLARSNRQLQEYSDSIRNDTSLSEDTRQDGDKDCLEAIRENVIVIDRQKERVQLLKQEVQRRGGRWHDKPEDGNDSVPVNGQAHNQAELATESSATAETPGGRLTDEELRRQMMDRLSQDDDNEEDGMHL